MRAQRILLTLVSAALGAWDTFPAKSVNLNSADAVAFFKQHNSETLNVADAHAVHSIQASDGTFVLVGKGFESEGNPISEAFAVRLDLSGKLLWMWKSNIAGQNDLANAVVQLPNGGDLLVVGSRAVGGEYRRCITKLTLSTGGEVWTSTDFGDAAGTHGAWEHIELTQPGQDASSGALQPGQQSVLLGGLKDKTDTNEFHFKSYGNAEGGTGVAMQIPVSVFASAPTAASATWTSHFPDYHTVKAVRPLAGGESAVLLWKGYGDIPRGAALARLSASGALVWGPTNYGGNHGEATEMVPSADSASLYMTGHGYGNTSCCATGPTGKLFARLSKVNSATGAWEWTKSYDAGGSKWIKNECFGVVALADGNVVMSCGTGVENCDGMTGSLKVSCEKKEPMTVDERPGALKRSVSVWQSLSIKTDTNGALLWQLTVQGRNDNAPALGQPGWRESSTGSEYVTIGADGNLYFVQDEAEGIALMKLTESSVSPSSSPSHSPSSPSLGPSLSPSSAPSPSPSSLSPSSPPPSPKGTEKDAPCFPSSAMVIKADGMPSRIDSLREGDAILAATADGAITTDTVSFLSIAKPDAAAAAFLVLTTGTASRNLTLTAEHHLPIGAKCCSTLKQAKDVVVGDTVWTVASGATIASAVTKVSGVTQHGLHSPVLTNGGFPVVDGTVTSFDSIDKVVLAKHGLAPLVAACKATDSCETLRTIFGGNHE